MMKTHQEGFTFTADSFGNEWEDSSHTSVMSNNKNKEKNPKNLTKDPDWDCNPTVYLSKRVNNSPFLCIKEYLFVI